MNLRVMGGALFLGSFRDGPKGRTRNPEPSSLRCSGFRARAFGASRNDRKKCMGARRVVARG